MRQRGDDSAGGGNRVIEEISGNHGDSAVESSCQIAGDSIEPKEEW